jgi:hypothetical protein
MLTTSTEYVKEDEDIINYVLRSICITDGRQLELVNDPSSPDLIDTMLFTWSDEQARKHRLLSVDFARPYRRVPASQDLVLLTDDSRHRLERSAYLTRRGPIFARSWPCTFLLKQNTGPSQSPLHTFSADLHNRHGQRSALPRQTCIPLEHIETVIRRIKWWRKIHCILGGPSRSRA